MERDEAKKIIEALLFVSDKPVTLDVLTDIIKGFDEPQMRSLVDEVNNELVQSGRSFTVKEIAGGFQMMTDPIYSKWISELYKKPADKLRGPALETLAIIAYKQPITRSEIEAIRGVNVDGVLNTLEEKTLIKPKGRREGPGRPILYGTTNEFLMHFGLKSLDELPNLKEFQEADLDFIKEQGKHDIIDTQTGKVESKDVAGETGADGDRTCEPASTVQPMSNDEKHEEIEKQNNMDIGEGQSADIAEGAGNGNQTEKKEPEDELKEAA